jgi:hypothetical protein
MGNQRKETETWFPFQDRETALAPVGVAGTQRQRM